MLTDRRLIPILLALTGCVFLVFGLWPGIDLAVASAFYHVTQFPLRQMGWIEALRNALWDVSILVPVIALFGTAGAWFRGGWILGLPARIWGYVLLLFLLGPGLLVNVLLKSHWGRARPTQVVEFGGTAQFTPYYQISDQCTRNCSFVSGEGSGSMAMAISALLILSYLRPRLSPSAYRAGQFATWLMLLFVGFQRVAAGGHFLSDVVLAWLFTALIGAILAKLLLAGDALPRQAGG